MSAFARAAHAVAGNLGFASQFSHRPAESLAALVDALVFHSTQDTREGEQGDWKVDIKT
jgi:hypothetical protein